MVNIHYDIFNQMFGESHGPFLIQLSK